MAQNAIGVEVPAGSDAFDPQGDMVELGDSLAGMVVVPVANTTARAALVSSLGWSPSSSRPVYVHRGDAPAGRELEYTTNGSDWSAVAGSDSGWQPLATFGTVGGSASSTFRSRRIGGRVHVKGTLQPNSGTIPLGQSTSVGVVAAGHRPSETIYLTGDGFIAGSSSEHAPRVIIAISSSGNMTVWATAALTSIIIPSQSYLLD